MFNYIARFVLIYFIMIFSLRLLGKRQVSQMQMSELVSAFFLSELATSALIDKDMSFFRGLLPIVLMIALELCVSFLAIKLPFMKRIVDFTPDFLIKEGKILKMELMKNRITVDELFSLLRLSGFYDITEVRFAILEPNGQLSVIPYSVFETATRNDLNLSADETGFSVAVIDDGEINEKALKVIGKTKAWLLDELRKKKIRNPDEVFVMTSDFRGHTTLIKNDATKPS